MAQNFRNCDRDQPMLLPPDLRDWLDEDHLAWFVIEAIEELDLDPFYGSYRADGHGRAAHEPQMMLTLLTYAYGIGERSSRGIERRCREDIACRVISANQIPDHATIARFRGRHQHALGELFGQILALCVKAGLVETGVLAVDGSKLAAAASDSAIRTYEQIAAEILTEADELDAAEDGSTAPPAATSCPSDSRGARAAAPGFATQQSSSRSSAPRPASRLPATAPAASRTASAAWSRTGSGDSTGRHTPTTRVRVLGSP